jgi:hypothetical protein
MPSLSADVAHAGDPVREAYRRRMVDVIATLAPAMPGNQVEQEQAAWTLVASIVGAVTIARALPTGDQSQATLDVVLRTALQSIRANPDAFPDSSGSQSNCPHLAGKSLLLHGGLVSRVMTTTGALA